MRKLNKSLHQANSSKNMQAYRARNLAKKKGISYENALSLIETEDRGTVEKAELAREKKRLAREKKTAKRKLLKGKKISKEEAELFAKKEKIKVGHAYCVLRGQWTLEKAKSRRSKGCNCSGCSSGKACKLTWLRRVSGSYGSKK
jgi:hypothetical protein